MTMKQDTFFEDMNDIQTAVLRSIHALNDANHFLCDALAMQLNTDDKSLRVDQFRDLIGSVRVVKDMLFYKYEDIAKILKMNENE